MSRFPLALLLAAGLAVSGCAGPVERLPDPPAKPGWGRTFQRADGEARVRAVPGAAAPAVPAIRLGKPGWGRG